MITCLPFLGLAYILNVNHRICVTIQFRLVLLSGTRIVWAELVSSRIQQLQNWHSFFWRCSRYVCRIPMSLHRSVCSAIQDGGM
jgi:hypothetical protein